MKRQKTGYRSVLLIAFAFSMVASPGNSQSPGSENKKEKLSKIVSWWSFDAENNNEVYDRAGEIKDIVHGNFKYVPGVVGKAIKLDGFRTYIERKQHANQLTGAFTVEAWLALACYPWSWSPVIDCSYGRISGFFFGINPEGKVGFKIGVGNTWYELMTERAIPLRDWTHIAAVFEPDQKLRIMINGEEAATTLIDGDYVPVPWRAPLTMGRNATPQTWHEAQLKTEHSFFYLDGLLDEVKITAKAKTKEEVVAECTSIEKRPVPALSKRDELPTGPVGSGEFGAYYTKLNYYKEWDDLWRVGDVPDIFVRFDESPVQLVCWRGASFVPCWVTENGIWYLNEWLETWGGDVVSCAEPIMDRHCRFSHVRLIENTDARVVIHWRYALNDAFYNFVAMTDDGRGEWCDEYHIIYPDQVGIRKMELHYSKPERKHDWVEQIIVLPPGKYPKDVIETESVSLLNMKGNEHKYAWDENLEIEMPEPEKANISFINLKSKYKPFFIISPNPVKTVEGEWSSPFFRTYAAHMAGPGYRPNPAPSPYGWWDHWPVAQVPGDGRWVTIPDRPSHFNLTTFVQWEDYEYNEQSRTRIMLTGMTDKKAKELVPLAKSWLHAPELSIESESYQGGIYDMSERAYILQKTNKKDTNPCRIIIKASKEHPLLNPSFIIKNWGNQLPLVTIDGEKIKHDGSCRSGFLKKENGTDMILWLKMERQEEVEITLNFTEE